MKLNLKHNAYLALVFGLIALLLSSFAFALSSFRCGQAVVQKNDSKIQTLSKCGEPLSASLEGTIQIGNKYLSIERWIYRDRGGVNFRALEFHGDSLKKIEYINK